MRFQSTPRGGLTAKRFCRFDCRAGVRGNPRRQWLRNAPPQGTIARPIPMFQSAPSRGGGETHAIVQHLQPVSIHAPAFEGRRRTRAHAPFEQASDISVARFQSTPSAGERLGETWLRHSPRSGAKQSTPPRVGAKRGACFRQRWSTAKSTPPSRRGRNRTVQWRLAPRTKFNPRPARWLGETRRQWRRRIPADVRFNPRPARGWTRTRRKWPVTPDGFNPRPARRLGETPAWVTTDRCRGVLFQSTPSREGRNVVANGANFNGLVHLMANPRPGWAANVRRMIYSFPKKRFQSTPSAEGESRQPGVAKGHAPWFQSTPSVLWPDHFSNLTQSRPCERGHCFVHHAQRDGIAAEPIHAPVRETTPCNKDAN